MRSALQLLVCLLAAIWLGSACTATDETQIVERADACERADDILGESISARRHLFMALDCRLATFSPGFLAGFERGDIGLRTTIDQLRAIIRALESVPDPSGDPGEALTIVYRASIDAGAPMVVGAAFRPILRNWLTSDLSSRSESFAAAFDQEVLLRLSVDELHLLYTTINELPRGEEMVLTNLATVYEVAEAAKIDDKIVATGFTRVLREEIATLLSEFLPSFAQAFDLNALNESSPSQLQAFRGEIAALPRDAQPISQSLGPIYDHVRSTGSTAGLVTASYARALIRDAAAALAVAHPNFQLAFQQDGLDRLDVEHLRVVLQVIRALPDKGRDEIDAFASLHIALVENGLREGASLLGYRDLLEHRIDAIVAGMHENFRRVFDGSALHRSPLRHLEVLEETLRELPYGYDEDGATALIAVQAAGQEAGVELDIGYSRLLAELRAPILAAIERTLEDLAPAFVDALSISEMTAMSPDVLEAVSHELASLPDRGENVGNALSRVLAAAVVAGHDPADGDFGVAAFRVRMQTELRTVVATMDDAVRSHLNVDAVRDADVQLQHLQAVVTAATAVRESRDPIEALEAIHVAAVKAGMETATANFGLTDVIVSKLQERFSADRVLSRAGTAASLTDQVDAVALAAFRTATRFYVPTSDPVALIEAMHRSAVQAGMNPDSTDFGAKTAVNLLTPVQVTRTWITNASTGEAVFRWNMVNYYDVGIKAVRFAIYAYDSFGGALGGGCLPFPARGELRLTQAQQYGRDGQGVGGLSWWWEGWRCTARADRFDLRIRDVVFVDGTRWAP